MDADESRDHVVPGSDGELQTDDVRGYDFRGTFDLESLIDSYATTGFQATHLAEAVDIATGMQDDGATVFLTCTSNIVSSGLREVVAALIREGHVDVLITTSGSLTEDVIKTAKPFKMGEWDADEAKLREEGINRLGNIFVPSDRYVWLEEYLYEFFDDFFAEEKTRTPTAFARELGERLDDEDSVLKQAADNDVPVYCPALTDAEVGNFLYYYRQMYDESVGIEILDDYERLIEDGLDADTTGLIAVGDGVPKHHAIMTNLFRGGAEYAVYISTGMEGDGSLSGAPPTEAVSWGKIKSEETNYTQIEAEATLVFPLLVAAAFDMDG
ncbi:deoxyhypusine synthase [Natronomonas pharaonis DSM 2160]|uniref:Probable deoxyhypusine synthase n=1 Tax=Natronomonas pharaonis (strain ATCC 35678 / DSM 2160 / CIP 103997 / JCM 8858 / NBRC 14720 / NCIMB 2260 / Gabara) TaxID=348780 RepID=A0A1U7EYQ5_NATPD|nr:deoxyhypusine synthase [Natronomonas pharaonis]CAI50380.1 deoxyhypusine synthase [Natronomonas pharaonis DSM 2160]